MKNEYIKISLILSLLLCLFYWNVVFGGATLMSSAYVSGTMPDGPFGYSGHRVSEIPVIDAGASAWQDLPLTMLTHKIYSSGKFPLWNPHQSMGTPLAADMQSAVFFPLKFIVFLFPSSITWDLYLLFRLFMAGFFTYLFLRTIKIGVIGALVSAIIFMFSGYLTLFIDAPFLNVDILVPLVLFAMEKLLINANLYSLALVSFATCVTILGGMPESTFFSLFFACAYYFYRTLQLYPGKILSIIISLKRLFIGISLGFAQSSLLLLPFLEYIPLSWHTHSPGVGLEHFNIHTAYSLLIPYLTTQSHEKFFYIGILPCFLAAIGMYHRPQKNRSKFFFFGFIIFYLLKCWGVPVVTWVSYLPFFNVSYFPQFAFPVFIFSVSVLAGFGIENIYERRLRIRLINPRGLCLLLILGLVFEQFLYAPKNRAKRYNPFTVPPYIEVIKKDTEIFRILGLDNILYPNTSSAYALDDIRSLNALHVERYMRFIKELVHPQIGEDRFSGEGLKKLDFRILNLLNVKYILFTDSFPKNHFLDSPNLDLIYDGEVKIYRNHSVYPRAFVAHNAIVDENDATVFKTLKDKDFDFKKNVILDRYPIEILQKDEASLTAIDQCQISILDYKTDHVLILSSLDREGFLVLTDTYYPGWIAIVDGKQKPIYRVDYLFRAVHLPSGSHRIEFIYKPNAFRIGLAISIISALLVIAMCIFEFNNRRNPRGLSCRI